MKVYFTFRSTVFLFTTAALNFCVEGGMKPTRESINGVISYTSHSRSMTEMPLTNSSNTTYVDIVFSDLDGTLIHYPRQLDHFLQRQTKENICLLPASSTGLVGVVSATSLQLIRDIRQTGAMFVLVSGMRSSTLLKRLPYLPKADAYCCEAGGRIFYPTQVESNDTFHIIPKEFPGATPEDLYPFSLIEDIEWRKRMEKDSAAGIDGYFGNEVESRPGNNEKEIPIIERQGYLWDFSRSLSKKGFIIDAAGYCTCFRVNRQQQEDSTLFDTLINSYTEVPTGLASSTNLGCVDFYPILSGKKNCCDFLRNKFTSNTNRIVGKCFCLCDDDNDIEMALSCMHAYLPSISSESMKHCVQSHPGKFTVVSTSMDGDNGIKATEQALDLVLQQLKEV